MNKNFTFVTNVAAPTKNLSTAQLRSNDALLKDTTLTGDTFISQATETSAHLNTSQLSLPTVAYDPIAPGAPTITAGVPIVVTGSTDVAGTVSMENTTGTLTFDDQLVLTFSKAYQPHLLGNRGPVVLTEQVDKSDNTFGKPVVITNTNGFAMTGWYIPVGSTPGAPIPVAQNLKFNYFVIGVAIYPPPEPVPNHPA